MDEQQFQFEWDEAKAAANLRKHGVSFELASSIFGDPRILTLADTTHREYEERWFSIGVANNGTPMSVAYLDGRGIGPHQDQTHNRSQSDGDGDSALHGEPMTNHPFDEEMPMEIDFGKATRGHHHIPAEATVFLPALIERSVWEYFSDKAERKGVDLSQLLTDVLKRDIEINEALK